MSGTLIEAIIRHKQILIAAIAVTGLIGYGLPLNQFAQATILSDIFGTDNNDGGDDDSNTQTIEQPIEQEIDQEVDQSEENEQDNDNTQTQVGVIAQDIAQGIVDGDDEAKSSSESGKARADKKGYARSSATSGDATNANIQLAQNNAVLNQNQQQTVSQSNVANFGDDTAELAAANVAIPIAVPINIDQYLIRLLNDD
jgi:hypothetical protein